MRYLIAIIVFLALVCVYLNFRVDILKKENTRLESENNTFISNIKEYKKDAMAANNEIKEHRKKISVDKMALDWYNSKLPDAIVDELHKH